MTYSAGNLIVPADLNGFLKNNTYYMHHMWAQGSGDYGYGQTEVALVAQGDLVVYSHWSKLVDYITKMANHQGTSITSLGTVNQYDLIKIINAIDADIQLIQTNRMNAASTGATSTASSAAGAWSQYCQFTATVSFPSADAARYFFNAGGQLGVSAYHPGGGAINDLISNICSNLGTVWLSGQACKIAGTNFTPNMKVGGASGPSDSSNTGVGYHSLGGSTRILHQTSSAVVNTIINRPHWGVDYWYGADYTPNTYADLYVGGGGSTVTFTLVIDEVPNGLTTNAGSTMYVTTRAPSTSYLTDPGWTPSVSISIAAA